MTQDSSYLGSSQTPVAAPNSDDKTMAILSHILAIVPGIGILGPLIIWLIKKDDSSYVAYHSKESLNFQITVILAYIVAAILVILLIGLVLFWVIGIVNVILVIVATVKASEGQLYRYPVNLRLIK